MFTGIIEEIGTVAQVQRTVESLKLTVEAPIVGAELHVDDSIAINGVCHTVVWCDTSRFQVDSVAETQRKSTIGSLMQGARVNLELPMRLNERLGGHLVLGHVDTVGDVTDLHRDGNSWMVTISYDKEFDRYVIPVGSIAIDGVSLTVARAGRGSATVAIIPHTMEKTVISQFNIGSRVNIEFDVIGKYVERLTNPQHSHRQPFPTLDTLRQMGY